MYLLKPLTISLLSLSLLSCDNKTSDKSSDNIDSISTSAEEKKSVVVPNFNEQNAYDLIAKQVSFGPRVPNTPAQIACANWLQQQLEAICDTVFVQNATLLAGDQKTKLKCINLIGSINPQAKKRILLLAHWDTRPWADRDVKDKDKAILGADDGGSGTAVILEIAKTIKNTPLANKDIGIDILLADVEDYGKSEWGGDSYALGTQYWAKNPHIAGYTANHGILLDMVGGKHATFTQEGYSRQYANHIVQDVWKAGRAAGYSSYFLFQNGPYIEDDHVPVNEIIKIPTIDIINLPFNSSTGFVQHWHTHSDNMDAIDKSTLKAVGQTLLHYLYNL